MVRPLVSMCNHHPIDVDMICVFFLFFFKGTCWAFKTFSMGIWTMVVSLVNNLIVFVDCQGLKNFFFIFGLIHLFTPHIATHTHYTRTQVLYFFTKGTKRKYQWLTIVHNFLLMLESVYILVMHSREIFLFVRDNGLGYWGLYCDPHHLLDGDSDLRFYQSLFYLSKYHELFDTVIVVLRGRSPSMLQLFHHTIMLLVTYYNRWPYLLPAMWLSVWLNLLVHVYMYGYFALRAAGFELSWARRYITSCQIAQFWVILVHALPW